MTQEVETVVDLCLTCITRMEDLSDTVPGHSAQVRGRTGLVCCPEHRWGRRLPEVEECITEWLAEMLREQGYDASNEVKYASRKLCDVVIRLAECEIWLEAKPIWSDWISDGSSGNRINDYPSARSRNIDQLIGDREKLAAEHPVAGDYWALLAVVFQHGDKITQDVIEAVGPGWQHRSRRVLDQCNGEGEDYGCTPILFWRPAVSS